MTEKPHAPSCERNREPILAILRDHAADRSRLLEIGSGTGQHAVYFAPELPHLTWQCSDLSECIPGICAWLNEAALPNTPPPLTLDVAGTWPTTRYDCVFTANTLHIMAWPQVEDLFQRLGTSLTDDGKLIVYGPFNYGGTYTSESNAQFDGWLKARGAHQGIRDFEAVASLAEEIGLALLADVAMPSNNRSLIWQRR